MEPNSAFFGRIAAGRTDLVVELGESILAPDDPRLAALVQHCAYFGDVSALRVLLSRNATLEALGADLGLNAAAFHGHWQLCQFLLESGAPVEGRDDKTGETPLHASMTSEDRTRHDAVARVLLRAGANVHARTIPNVATGSFMRDCRTRGETPLHRAAAFGTAPTIKLLLDAGADREARDAHGDSPLAWASWYRRPTDVLAMLAYGPHRVDPDRRTMRENLIGDPEPSPGQKPLG
jgi:uncharacterized protein